MGVTGSGRVRNYLRQFADVKSGGNPIKEI